MSGFGGRSDELNAILVGVLGVLLVASGLSSGSGSVARLGAVLAVPVVWLALRRDWRRDQGPTALALAGGALVVGSPLLVRIAVQVADPDSFFTLRQELAETRHLSLPLGAVLLQFLPLWILAGTALTLLVRRARTARDDAVLTALTGLLVTTFLLTFNGVWGFDTEPYRSCRTGRSSWRSSRCRPWRRRCWRRAGCRAAAARRPRRAGRLRPHHPDDTRLRAQHEGPRVHVPSPERLAYEKIADVTGDDLAVYDTCFRPDLVKLGGGGRVAYQNVGMAIASHHEAITVIDTRIRHRTLPGDSFLRRVDARWFVSQNHCDGVDPALLRQRFGAPVRLTPPDVAGLAGAPADLTYELYRTGG